MQSTVQSRITSEYNAAQLLKEGILITQGSNFTNIHEDKPENKSAPQKCSLVQYNLSKDGCGKCVRTQFKRDESGRGLTPL